LTQARPERTPIATLICIFEAIIVAWTIFGRIAMHVFRGTDSARAYHVPLLQTTIKDLGILLALAAAIALWQMHRSAFYLLAIRFVLSLAWFIGSLLHAEVLPTLQDHTWSTIIHLLSPLFGLCFLIVSAAITWYVYNVTKPKAASIFIPEIESPAASQIESPDEATQSNQSITQFYLASEEDQKRSN
jgi:hypothetical protein